MGLSAEERKQLEALTKKSKEPDPPSPNITYNLDLNSDTAWERAGMLGLLPKSDSEGDGDGDGDGEEEADDTPRRRGGYFPEG